MLTGKKVRLFCSDLDGTLLGDESECAAFVSAWDSIEGEKPFLVYSTGRLDADAKQMILKHRLPQPDFYISGVGTMIFDVAKVQFCDGFSKLLNEEWDRDKVVALLSGFSDLETQPEEQQHDWKCSWFWKDKSKAEIDELGEFLSENGVKAQVIYSTRLDLDILPLAANKGNAVSWLAAKLGVGLDEIVVAGDSGNDSSMFLQSGIRGIAPANSSPELIAVLKNTPVYFSKNKCLSGVHEGLQYYQVFI